MIEKKYNDLTQQEQQAVLNGLLALPFTTDVMQEVLQQENTNMFNAENCFCIAAIDLKPFIESCIGLMLMQLDVQHD